MRLNKPGQALVEFALVLPILLLLFATIIDGAMVVQGYLAVNHAAREAARFAVTYQPVQGQCLGEDNQSWPMCPQGGGSESDTDYYERRVALIKQRAQDAATGLRISAPCLEEDCISTHLDTPGMFGVRVWGFQGYDEPEQIDQPGLPGLPVRVQVIHNVELMFYSTVFPWAHVEVDSDFEMINEGVETGLGSQLPPTPRPITPVAPPEGGDPPPPDPPDDTPTPGPSPTPAPRELVLNFESAVNQLPDDRAHEIVAHLSEGTQDIAGAPIIFSTDNGDFSYGGDGTNQEVTVMTDNQGEASATIYANEPTVANITVWADDNANGDQDAEEAFDTAIKEWEVGGPYIIVVNHKPEPLDVIGVHLRDHNPNSNDYALWWCPSPTADESPVDITAQLQTDLTVDPDTWNLLDIEVQVPDNTAGEYRIESHSLVSDTTGGCGLATSLVAYSSNISVQPAKPDLIITDVQMGTPLEEIATGEITAVTVEISNTKAVTVTGGPFDVDVYPHLAREPYVGQIGGEKQWVETFGPLASKTLTMEVQVSELGENKLWAQIDSTNYIDEVDEENNTFGPITFTTCFEDDFDDGLDPAWQTENIGPANGSTSVNENGALEISSKGATLWSSDNKFYYIYLPWEDDFDARLKVIDEPDTNQFAKIGLHVREGTNGRDPYIMNMITHADDPAAEQAAYRDYYNGGAGRVAGSNDYQVNLPIWVRITREGNTYGYYTSYASDPEGSDWEGGYGTHTAPKDLGLIGIAQASYNNNKYGVGIVDDFRVCRGSEVGTGAPPRPPGLIECEELINIPSFEGNPDTVFEYWKAGEPLAYRRSSLEHYQGTFAMRLHASLGSYEPSCSQNNLSPYLYQDVKIPTEVYSISTFVVDGYYLVNPSDLDCSNGVAPDPDDKVTLELKTTGDDSIVAAQDVIDGSVVSGTWQLKSVSLGDHFNVADYAGQTVRIYWDATHDGDYDGTFFYLDNISAQVCTQWPEPEPEPGAASIGGVVWYQGRRVSKGANVYAYAQNGEVYRTITVQDGSYGFYNIPPDDYVVYAEAMIGDRLRTAVTEVTVAADEHRQDVSLTLQ
ncbi:MAG: TadE/TadG family type IV pilus assembly protein [Anaerolineales bacterium]